MNLPKEQIYDDRDAPEEDIIYPIRHRILLLVLGFVRYTLTYFPFLRHVGRARRQAKLARVVAEVAAQKGATKGK